MITMHHFRTSWKGKEHAMDNLVLGPFQIDFTAEGVEFRTRDQSDQHTLTYAQCYQLLAALYQNRDELYRLSHKESKQAGESSTYVVGGLTYTIDDTSVGVAGWERLEDEQGPPAGTEPPPSDTMG